MLSRVFGWAGLALLAAGVMMLLLPVTANGNDCGSPLMPAAQLPEDEPDSACPDLRSLLRVPELGLAGMGVILLVGAGVTRMQASPKTHERAA
ncbi:hypothetical protein [Microbispora triticiradicis]|uniref:hypothetical protein n=1 Tax=Microbispora triticiradicis TaxID=2200763 RepID=UPI001AD66A3C|nr:hypothetical protein [Microbispora triticiradicis]MBO4269845.1 hypothetical protein [Microbispora triticiradicis]